MGTDLVAQLLPTLAKPLEVGFNVFDVMHHGTHEKQISNVFRWLLTADGTHGLHERFVEIFIAEIKRNLVGSETLPSSGYWVRQEVNVADDIGGIDIADLVLENKTARVVIENYFTSDGHGHGYADYLRYSQRLGGQGVVVMLCDDMDRSRLSNGWDQAALVTYRAVLENLHAAIETDRKYQASFPEPYSFIDQMYRKYVRGSGRMEDGRLIDFVVAMCETGEGARYSKNNIDQVTEQFASDIQEQARERFGEGRELLQRVKDRLKAFSSHVLQGQLDAATSPGFVHAVAANYVGKWRWEVILDLGTPPGGAADNIQLIFGPSAWHTQRESTADPVPNPDYSRLFIYRHSTQEIRQSTVTMQEVLDVLDSEDTRLRDEILTMVGEGV